MKHVVPTLALSALLAGVGSAFAQSTPKATVGGVVRDVHGIPQMGALVELLGPDAAVVARAFTDDHGRYLLHAVLPGSYQLRASAAFLVPAMRTNFHVRSGVLAVADLTMTAIFETGALLPTERRTPSEPTDDWRWTLRSTANRPLLRLADDGSGTGVSSSADHRRDAVSQGQVMFIAGDGSFGQGGNHQALTMDRTVIGGDVSVVRADLGDTGSGATSSMVLAAGLQHERTWGGGTRLFVSFASHPEIHTGNAAGLEVLRTASTEKVVLGDAFVVDAGTLFTAERLLGTQFESAPYIRIAFRPSQETSVEYRLATDRVLQSSEDLDRMSLPEEALGDASGHPMAHKGLHQEIAVVQREEERTIEFAVYRDGSPFEMLQGGGLVSAKDIAGTAALLDPTTDTLRLAVAGFHGTGVRMAWQQKIGSSLKAFAEADMGTVLKSDGVATDLQHVPEHLRARALPAASAGVEASARRSGTILEVHYRWQPTKSVTQVSEYDTALSDAYLGVHFRQKLWAGRRMKRVNAFVDGTNLLSEGYDPILGADGQMLFLAQVPRSVQGGLAFSF